MEWNNMEVLLYLIKEVVDNLYIEKKQAYRSGRGYIYGGRPSNPSYGQRGMDYDDYPDNYQGERDLGHENEGKISFNSINQFYNNYFIINILSLSR